MADFKTHWRVGLVTSTAGACIAHWQGLAPPKLLPLLVSCGWIGSIIPDIDSDTSKPRRLIFNGLSFILPAALIYRVEWVHQSPERAVLFGGLCALFVLYPLKWFFGKCTRHRGAYHSVPAALIYGTLCALLAHHEDAPRSLQVAISSVATLGFLTHLILDELWAVDFNGNLPRRKRSFGTALSWRVTRPHINMILYLTLGLSVWLWWTQWHRLPFLPEPLSVILDAWLGALKEVTYGQ